MLKYFILTPSVTLCLSCATFFSHDTWNDVPKYSDLPGLYISTFSSEQDSLFIIGLPYTQAGSFFLTTKDSIGKELLLRGNWEYLPGTEFSDYGSGIPGYGLIYLNEKQNKKYWMCDVHFQSDKEGKNGLILDTLYTREDKNSHPDLNSKGKPFRFIKVIYKSAKDFWQQKHPENKN